MRIIQDTKLDFKDVLILPKRSTLASRSEVDLSRTFTFKHSGATWSGVPIMAANMDGVGTWAMAQELERHNMFTCLVKSYTWMDWTANYKSVNMEHVAISTGIRRDDLENVRSVMQGMGVKYICIDVANGYSEHFADFVGSVRREFPQATIIAGNVVTPEMTEELILRGADIVKVGIGPGSVCTTRIQTGVGYPQLSAIIECADAAHGLGGHIIADGGCTCPGDVAKAFGAGADFVMLGGMLSGHDEGEGEVISEDGKNPRVVFYGMSSDTAMDKHHGGVANYRSSEGRTVEVKYRGAVKNTVLDLLGGLRSTCTYVGAPTLKQLSKCTTFIRVNRQINDVFLK
jgi:GMP reductase